MITYFIGKVDVSLEEADSSGTCVLCIYQANLSWGWTERWQHFFWNNTVRRPALLAPNKLNQSWLNIPLAADFISACVAPRRAAAPFHSTAPPKSPAPLKDAPDEESLNKFDAWIQQGLTVFGPIKKVSSFWTVKGCFHNQFQLPRQHVSLGSWQKRQKPQAPTPQAPIRNRRTRKVANAKGLNCNTNLT